MITKRTLKLAGSALAASVALASCQSAPDYALEPAIDFSSLTVVHGPDTDTLKFALNFRDGDGDLGLSDDDTEVAPWNATTGGHNNRGYSYNYFIQPYIKTADGTFVPFITPGGTLGEYDSRYLRLDKADAKPAPLKGELRYTLPLFLDGDIYYPGQVFRFEIGIMDRSLNESNFVTTSEVTLGQ